MRPAYGARFDRTDIHFWKAGTRDGLATSPASLWISTSRALHLLKYVADVAAVKVRAGGPSEARGLVRRADIEQIGHKS